MMPRQSTNKRTSQEALENSPEPSEAGVSGKRRRISLACDGCRTLRDKCDGERPTCGRCAAEGRECLYNLPSKKRGVPAGYLRAIEAALEYLLERIPGSEGAIHHLLATGTIAPANDDFKRLSENWTARQVHGNIRRMLKDGPATPPSNAGSEPKNTAAGPATSTLSVPADIEQPAIRLPSCWRRLVDIFFAYTHCWLPLFDKHEIIKLAIAFPPQGIPIPLTNKQPSFYAELWAILALASFQDTSSRVGSSPTLADDGSPSPSAIFSIARAMIPSEEEQFELAHIRSLLLHSMVLLGRGSGLSAWMLVGRSVRVALHLLQLGQAGQVDTDRDDVAFVFGACLILNSITSAFLGQPTFLKIDTDQVDLVIDAMAKDEDTTIWVPVAGFGDDDGPAVEMSPKRTFAQLYKLTRILGQSLDSGAKSAGTSRTITSETLIQSLEPTFAFCNSLVLGASKPLVPSSFLLQAVFLTAALHVVSDHSPSLLSCLIEGLEDFRSHFGDCGLPPVVMGLLGLVLRCGHVRRMHGRDRPRLDAITEATRAVWAKDDPSTRQTAGGIQDTHLTPTTSLAGESLGRSEPSGSSGKTTTQIQRGTDAAGAHAILSRDYANNAFHGLDASQHPDDSGSQRTDIDLLWQELEDGIYGTDPMSYIPLFTELPE